MYVLGRWNILGIVGNIVFPLVAISLIVNETGLGHA